MRLLLDEHLPPRVAAELRRHGHDVTAAAERPDLRNSPDGGLWSVARAEQRTIVTQDISDFIKLSARDAAVSKPHPGLVLIHAGFFGRGRPDTGRLVSALGQLLSENPAEHALSNRVMWLKPARRP